MKRFLILFMILLMTAPQVMAEESSAPNFRRAEDYRVGVGDLLKVVVYDEPDLSAEVRVLTDGNISLPLINSVPAAGLTVLALEKEVTRLLAEKYLVDPHVTVIVAEFSRIFVFGEVKNPGAFPLTGRMTVFEAVTLAGGFNEVANRSAVKVIRQTDGKEQSFQIDIEKLAKHGDTSQDLELQANDRVIVPRSFF